MGSDDPRVIRSRQVICEAALDEMAEVGYGAMTIESIAKRAGVGKATVYRHWEGKLDLVESALESMRADMPSLDDGTVRERVRTLLTWLAEYLSDRSGRGSCIPALVSASEYDPAVRRFHHEFAASRRRSMAELLQEGVDSGELRPIDDLELTAEMLVGPLMYRRMFTPEPFPPERVDDLIERVL